MFFSEILRANPFFWVGGDFLYVFYFKNLNVELGYERDLSKAIINHQTLSVCTGGHCRARGKLPFVALLAVSNLSEIKCSLSCFFYCPKMDHSEQK